MASDGVPDLTRAGAPPSDLAAPRSTSAALATAYATLPAALAAAARAAPTRRLRLLPERPGDPEVERTWSEVEDGARVLAAALAARGVGAGDRVLLVLPTCVELVEALFAVQGLGAVAVPSYPPAVLGRAADALERLAHVGARAAAGWCVTNRLLLPLLGGLGGGVREVLTVEGLAAAAPRLAGGLEAGAARAPFGGSDDPAVIQFSSGSTARPKGVVLTHANVLANLEAIGRAVEVGPSDSVCSWLPLYHDMGLVGALLMAVYWRLDLTLMSPMAFVAEPLRWLRELNRSRATLSPAPNFAYAACVRRAAGVDLGDLDLSAWRVACNGAEPVWASTLREFGARFAPCGFRPQTLLPVYGLAEASLALTFSPLGREPVWETVERAALARGRAVPTAAPGPTALEVVSVGSALPGHRVEVVDERGAALPERRVGHVVAAGPSIMKEYCGDPEATAAALRDGRLWTGDLGYLAGGALFVTGRAKDLIIVRGRNHHAEDLERLAGAVTGVRPGGVAAFALPDEVERTERVVLVCETRVAGAAARGELAQAVAAAVGAAAEAAIDEVVLVPPGAVPKTPSGKVQRGRCRDLYLGGELGRRRRGGAALVWLVARSLWALVGRWLRARVGRRRLRAPPPPSGGGTAAGA